MSIADEEVARVRAATDVVALISEHSGLKRQGTRWVGLCPFHQEKTPSFSVNAEMGVYYCFGCQRSGDAITFVRDVEHVDFVEAVRRLAERAGITITEDAVATAERRRRAPLYDALAKAVDFYHERLLSAADAGPARDYLRSRGYDGETVRLFQLGWAPDDWDALARHLGVPSGVLSDAGLGFVNRRGRQQDAFRGRIIFPIFDPSGRAIALGGRILPPPAGAPASSEAGPKYKNSPEGPIYSKRRTLYALNWAKKDVIDSGEVVVCEGYTDVIACFQAGLPRAVATCGTALGEEHFRLLRNFAKRVVLAFDADAAGLAGAQRVYEWERHHEIDVAVADLPPGSDPGELGVRDPERLRKAVADAQPFLRFQIERVLSAADLGSAEGRARAAEAALRAVVEHPNDLVRDQYLMMVADRCRLDPASLRPVAERLARSPRDESGGTGARSTPEERPARESRPGHVPAPPGAAARPQAPRPGLEALRLAVHTPERVAERLEPFLFADPLQRRAFETLASAESLQSAMDAAITDDELSGLLRRLVVEEPVAEADDVIVQLVRIASRRALAELQAEARVSPDDVARLAPLIARVRRDLDDLDSDDEASLVAADRLLAWLAGEGEETG
ncbi:MAG TPA: DNA primase [Acidimicrobiaceae bacterium]|nr:DNA primase [Acidimicrobiaceae bacterium]